MTSPTMIKHSLVYFLAIAAIAASPAVFAGAGQTSAGVTTTTGTVDPTAATQNVQSQSSNFVQENQAAQIGTPVSGVTGTAAKTGASNTAQGGDPSNTTGKPGDPNNPNDPKAAGAQAAAPVVPAAPPPEYVSNVKKVTRDPTATGVVVADNATTDGGTKLPTAPPSAATNSTAPANAVGAPGVQRQATASVPRVPRAAETAKVNAADRTPQQAAAVGGSGSAPDTYAFYIGIIIAGALLAFAAATFFRSDKSAK
jgi:hypothetical protein